MINSVNEDSSGYPPTDLGGLIQKLAQEHVPFKHQSFTISERAQSRLFDMSGNDQIGDALVTMGEQYSYSHTYDHTQLMMAGGVNYFKDPDSRNEVINIPNFYNFNPDVPFGDCRELAIRNLIKGRKIGLFSTDFDSEDLVAVLVRGNAPGFFISPTARHYWVGLISARQMRNQQFEEMVIFDPAYRRITTMQDDNYRIRPHDFSSAINTELFSPDTYDSNVLVGDMKYLKGNLTGFMFPAKNLGMTPDSRFGVTIMFGKDIFSGLSTVVYLFDQDEQIAYATAMNNRVTIWEEHNGYSLSQLSTENAELALSIVNYSDTVFKQQGLRN